MGWKCKDCHNILTDDNHTMARLSICNDCWGLRSRMVTAMNEGKITADQLQRVQRTTVRARRMSEVLAEIEA